MNSVSRVIPAARRGRAALGALAGCCVVVPPEYTIKITR